MLNLMDFAVNAGGKGITDLADGLVCLKLQFTLSLRHLDLILKIKTGFRFAFFIIKDALFLEDFLCGQLLTGGIQTLMSLFRLLFKTLDFLRCGSCFIRDRDIRRRLTCLFKNRLAIDAANCICFSDFVSDNGVDHHTARISRRVSNVRNRRDCRRGCLTDRQLFRLILGLHLLSRGFIGGLLILLWQKILRYRLLMLCRLFGNNSRFSFMRLYELGVFKSFGYSFGCTFREVFFDCAISGHPHDNLVFGLQLLMGH